MPKIHIRPALPADIPFLVETIIEAEKSGTDRLGYATLFDLSEKDFAAILAQILDEDVQGQELCISDFLIAMVNNEPASACCSWVEGYNGQLSKILKASVLSFYVPIPHLENAQRYHEIVSDLAIDRVTNMLQIESVYTRDKYRGMGLSSKLIQAHARQCLQHHPKVKAAQVILAHTNQNAFKAYTKLGFTIRLERTTHDPKVLSLLPAKGKMLMEANIEQIIASKIA